MDVVADAVVVVGGIVVVVVVVVVVLVVVLVVAVVAATSYFNWSLAFFKALEREAGAATRCHVAS